jgi:hypothetical protein
MKLLIMQSSQTFRHFVPLCPNVLLSTLFSNTLNLCSSVSVTNLVSDTYKTTGKVKVLYILICKFLDRRREDKRL